MNARPPLAGRDQPADPKTFSLVLGGPLFQLLRRVHLSDDALMLVQRRILVTVLITWLPLLALSALEHHVLSGTVTVCRSCWTWRLTSVFWWQCRC